MTELSQQGADLSSGFGGDTFNRDPQTFAAAVQRLTESPAYREHVMVS